MCSLGHGLCTFTAVPKSAQPCIPLGSLNWVLASAGVKAGMSPLPGGKQHCGPIWHVSSLSSVAMLHCELLYPYTFTFARGCFWYRCRSTEFRWSLWGWGYVSHEAYYVVHGLSIHSKVVACRFAVIFWVCIKVVSTSACTKKCAKMPFQKEDFIFLGKQLPPTRMYVIPH